MTVREIRGHLEDLYCIDVSPDLISAVTDAVLEEVSEWQNRSLDICYTLVFFDAIRVKIRDEGFVRNKAVYIALGILADGTKEILGIWIEQTEGAKFWLRVMNEKEPRRRRYPDRRRSWPQGLSRGDQRRLSPDHSPDLHRTPDPPFARVRLLEGRKAVVPALRAIYWSKDAEAGMRAFEDFEAGDWGATIFGDHPVLARQLGPRCAFLRPPENLRRIIYTTNAIEALNPKLRRAVRTRGHFPRDDAAMKLLYLVLTTIGGVLFAVLKGAIFIITNMFN